MRWTPRHVAPIALVLAFGLLCGCTAAPRTATTYHGEFSRAAVAADHALASAAGAEMLARGGNAVDAAVATSFTLSVVRPYSCGIGGGGFMVIKFNDDPRHGSLATALNYRETTPAAVGPDFYEKIADDPSASTKGGKAVATPGTVAGLLQALERYGTLDRRIVLAPAIRAAEQGFVVDQHYVDSTGELIRWYGGDVSRRHRFPFVWKRFLLEGKVKVGDRIRLPEQAEALRLIAADGAEAFYRGPIAAAIADAIARDGGVLNHDDLAGYQLREVEPLRFRALGREVLTMPPPSSGGVAIAQMLTMIDQTIPSPDAAAWNTAPMIHRRVEIMRHAFADRARWMGDPAFVNVPVQRMISPDYVAAMSGRVGPTTQPIDSYGGQPGGVATQVPMDGGTSHFSVVDARGNAVACTETINLIFGSCLAVEKYGFVLNNEMDDFTTRRGQPNAFKLVQSDQNLPEPGKRPLSSMSPTIVLDSAGRVEVVVGASGGPRIITGTTQVICNVLLFDLLAGEALRRPRVHHQWQPDVLYVEAGALENVSESSRDPKAALHDLGYTIETTDSVGNVQLIRRSRDGRRWDAASDPRKGGRPAGL